jgi:hypothetical protein
MLAAEPQALILKNHVPESQSLSALYGGKATVVAVNPQSLHFFG